MFNWLSFQPALRQRRVRVALAAPKVLYARVLLGPSVTINPVPLATITYDIFELLFTYYTSIIAKWEYLVNRLVHLDFSDFSGSKHEI
jgi:hypothetical protein